MADSEVNRMSMFLTQAVGSHLKDAENRFIKRRTTQPEAWKDGYYETYRLNMALHAVRLHPHGVPPWKGLWFGVDTYNARVARYKKVMALLNPAEEADSYVLQPGSVFNVGIANRQGILPGGGWQFEYVENEGPQPLHDEHVAGLKSNTRVPL